MTISFQKLWLLLERKGLTKKALARLAGIHPSTLTRMESAGTVSKAILLSICQVLECDINDIMELRAENRQEQEK